MKPIQNRNGCCVSIALRLGPSIKPHSVYCWNNTPMWELSKWAKVVYFDEKRNRDNAVQKAITHLEVLLSVEDNASCLYFAVLDVDLVTSQDNGNVFTHPNKILMPVGDVLVGDSWRHIKHDDSALRLDVVAIAKTTKLFLTCCVPHIEADSATSRAEFERVHLHTECCWEKQANIKASTHMKPIVAEEIVATLKQ